MEIREQFVLRASGRGVVFAELCREFGVSRKTGYKWQKRFKQQGVDGLADASRRPRRSIRVQGEVVLRVLELHARYKWGPKKLRDLLRREHGKSVSARTIARILRRAGIGPRRRRVRLIRSPVPRAPTVKPSRPNAVWTVDFKGWWCARDGQRCDPLTVRDAFSRYVLWARLVEGHTFEAVQSEFKRVFREFGLPDCIHVDNGEPFASTGARAGLTRLSAWWVSLGIRLVRSRPGKPQDNGAHERMHADIARDLQASPAATRSAQQRALSIWRRQFNEKRPHEALSMRRPADLYRPSKRPFQGPRPVTYSERWSLRRVSSKGFIGIAGAQLFLGEGLIGQVVGIEPLDQSHHRAWFYGIDLGIVEISKCA
jgi:transposase InsO family protein